MKTSILACARSRRPAKPRVFRTGHPAHRPTWPGYGGSATAALERRGARNQSPWHDQPNCGDGGSGLAEFAVWAIGFELGNRSITLRPADDVLATALGMPEYLVSLCFFRKIKLADGKCKAGQRRIDSGLVRGVGSKGPIRSRQTPRLCRAPRGGAGV